jgi:2-keto-3-deoxy-L-rhamnonate aldolase RhmA
MRPGVMVLSLGLAFIAVSSTIDAQGQRRLNPMIALHEKGLPVFGITHPAIVAGGRGRAPVPTANGDANGTPVAAPALPSLIDAARETVAYKFADFDYNNYSSANAERFMGYMAAILAAGGSMSSHAFLSKVPIVHVDPAAATVRIIEQLDMGHAGIILQQVESADEVRTALAAMRFKSQGGVRPDDGVGLAAAYWRLSEAEYLAKADPWPLNRNGELVLWAIIESKKGIANVREIAAVPGVTVLTVGAGTLGGVFSSTAPDGQRARDQAGFDAGVASVLAACKEFKVPCSYPANNPADIEKLMAQGFSVFTMQARNAAGFDAIAAGRRLSGRPVPPTP